MSEHNISFMAGFVTGLLLIIAAVLIIRRLMKKKYGANYNRYDERQKSIQGTAYKLGFFVIILYFIANSIVTMLIGNWADYITMNFAGVCLGITAYASYAIINNAYLSINARSGGYLILFSLMSIINISVFFINIGFNGAAESDIYSLNLICGITFAVLFIVMLAKVIIDKKNAEADI